jgi:hypothetical protein
MNDKLIEGIDYTVEGPNVILTALFHAKRGKCCGNGCRNCCYVKDIDGGTVKGTTFLKEEYKYLVQNFE